MGETKDERHRPGDRGGGKGISEIRERPDDRRCSKGKEDGEG